MPENVDAWAFWNKLSGQQNVGFGGKCGPLIFSSIQFIFDLYAVENRQETFEKVQLIHSIFVERTLKDG